MDGTGPATNRRPSLRSSVIRRALAREEFIPFFQPLVSMRTGQLAGFEILARWEDPKRGMIQPDDFIPHAERYGWIDNLTRQVLDQALRAAAGLPEHLTFSVNVSPYQLREPGLTALVEELSSRNGFSPTRLVVEITESALIDQQNQALRTANELRALGCGLSLDDFGTGYSSLLHLNALPFTEIKIDRGFVQTMTSCRESHKIVTAILNLGQSLGLRTVAEGVETQEHAEILLWLGSELGQGWFFGRPIPTGLLREAITTQRTPFPTSGHAAWKNIPRNDSSLSLANRLAQLQAVYEGSPIGLAYVDRDLHYLNVNRQLAAMNGQTIEQHLASTLPEILGPRYARIKPDVDRALRGETITDIEHPVEGSAQTRLASYQPAFDEQGVVVGISIILQDITERKRAEEALREREEHYRSIVEINSAGLWSLAPSKKNIETIQTDLMPPERHYPVNGATPLDMEQKRLDALHDLEIMDSEKEDDFDDLVRLASEICGAPISLVSLLDAKRQWFKAAVGLEVRETPIESSFCAHAIKGDRLFVVEDASAHSTFKENPLVTGNPHIRFYAGAPLYTNGVAIGSLCVIDTVPRVLSAAQRNALLILSRQVQTKLELRAERKKLLLAIETNRELARTLKANNRELSDANRRLERMASIDPLTGLLNRRAFDLKIQSDLQRARGSFRPLTLIVLDIDNFKIRNDIYGHAAGDDALRYLGAVLSASLRPGDSASRIGGEEFAVTLPNTSVRESLVVVSTIQARLAQEISKLPSITVSLGLADTESAASCEELMSQADQAMYWAKRNGKNRWQIFDRNHEEQNSGHPFTETRSVCMVS